MFEPQAFTVIDQSNGFDILPELRRASKCHGKARGRRAEERNMKTTEKINFNQITQESTHTSLNTNKIQKTFFSPDLFRLSPTLPVEHLRVPDLCPHEVLFGGRHHEAFGVQGADNIIPDGASLSVVTTHPTSHIFLNHLRTTPWVVMDSNRQISDVKAQVAGHFVLIIVIISSKQDKSL